VLTLSSDGKLVEGFAQFNGLREACACWNNVALE